MKTVESQIRAVLTSPVSRVWDVMTDNTATAWRSDLARVETAGEQFTEYTKGGFATVFTITEKTPGQRYAFTMENANLSGSWEGIFSPCGGGTELTLTERVTTVRFPMTVLAGAYLRRQQKQYLADLKKALGE